MLAWLSLYNMHAAMKSSDFRGGIPINETAMLLPVYPDVRVGNAFAAEMICTFIFVMINLLVKTLKTSPTNDGFLSCLAVAFTLLAMICCAGKISGACLNPAVGIAQTIFEICVIGPLIPTLPLH